MAFDLTGISNENEFYSDHYLREILHKKDLKDWVKATREKDRDAPRWESLRRFGPTFLQQGLRYADDPSLRIQREVLHQMLGILGYDFDPHTLELKEGPVPFLSTVTDQYHTHVHVIEAFDSKRSGFELLQLTVDPLQVNRTPSEEHSLEKLVKSIFFGEDPPRWILVTSLRTWMLFERGKWSGRRSLRFDWRRLYNRRTPLSTFQFLCMLLSRDSLCPGGGQSPVLDAIDEQSRAHAQGVSGSLKYALREAVELLGNEYLYQTGNTEVEPEVLTLECLRYMYRVLFLFTVEARRELGYLPMNAKVYREGYSMEQLRELEMVALTEENSGDGYFFHESIQMLFALVYEGRTEERQVALSHSNFDTFSIAPLRCDLFDPEKTPLLGRVRIRNRVWQPIIRGMSLGHAEGKGRRGRVSYAQLGVNHLGAVYEALLSYRGFIASEDRYEVKKKGTKPDKLDPAYFVNRAALEASYGEAERIHDRQGRLVWYPKGTFIYRLTGRAREESASFYTPESLTQCVVKYALEEVLSGKTADELLGITVCEPAMGSAAFLNEAVSQLAEAYMEQKTRERGETLSVDEYAEALQRVKLHLADNNVYGVDLNPVAVELGGVSLWLNTLVPGGFVPWFGNQLKCGNSLVGTWRRVYTSAQTRAGKWWTRAPQDAGWGSGTSASNTIYHFLLGDPGMVDYGGNKVIKQIAAQELGRFKKWKQHFTSALSAGEFAVLARCSEIIDTLWAEHVAVLRALEEATTDPFPIYPEEGAGTQARTSTRVKDEQMARVLMGGAGQNASAYYRLKMVMDYWCALWYWPIDKAALLPTRQQYLSDLRLMLAGREEVLQTSVAEVTEDVRDEIGEIDLVTLTQTHPRLSIVSELSQRHRFHHWQLEYADQFADKGGFDVVLGNPPWKKVQWIEQNIIADTDPRMATQRISATRAAKLREAWLTQPSNCTQYLREFAAVTAEKAFLNAVGNYPLLKGQQTNEYKSFLTTTWKLSSGSVGLLHPNGVYDDPRGARLREELYPRLRQHFRFANALKLFPEIHDQVAFSVNIYGQPREPVAFDTISYLKHPATVEASLKHAGFGAVPGIKTIDNKWDHSGHKDRIVRGDDESLALYAQLYDAPGTPWEQAQLPEIHSQPILRILRKIKDAERLGSLRDQVHSSQMWDETYSQRDGVLRRDTQFVNSARNWILSGPHFFVGNPFFKTPNEGCKTNADYSRLDLTQLPSDYHPRSNYVIACSAEKYDRLIPSTPWGSPHTSAYRVACRAMLDPYSERTLHSTIIPPGPGHIDAVQTMAFLSHHDLLRTVHGWMTIIIDGFLKTKGKGRLGKNTVSSLPILPFDPAAAGRVLGLLCLTNDYDDLWNDFTTDIPITPWAKIDQRLNPKFFGHFQHKWRHNSALRTDYERRQALIELDVLCAQALGITLEDLCALYRIQFPVLRMYENDTWYDQKGRIIFSRKNGEGPLPRKKKSKFKAFGIKGKSHGIALGWENVRHMKEGVVTYTFMDNTLPSGPKERIIEFHAPFDRCDREADYKEAWDFFEQRSNN